MEKYTIESDWPDNFEGFPVKELFTVLKEINSPGGTKAPESKIIAMRHFIHKYKIGVHGLKSQKGEIAI